LFVFGQGDDGNASRDNQRSRQSAAPEWLTEKVQPKEERNRVVDAEERIDEGQLPAPAHENPEADLDREGHAQKNEKDRKGDIDTDVHGQVFAQKSIGHVQGKRQ
jgi:hypothetical protein